MNPIDKLIGGKLYRVFLDDERFVREVIDGNEYHDVFDDLVVVDIGANIGTFSLWIYDRARVIHAIEPSPGCINLLKQTIEYNKLDKLKTYCIGISGNGGERQFYIDDKPELGGWKLDPNPVPVPNANLAMFPTKSIKEFLDDENIKYVDILKIDIEGGETEVFTSRAFEEVAHRISTIVGEYHNVNPSSVLESCGFRVSVDTTRGHFTARRV